MNYTNISISDEMIPAAVDPHFQHLLETYVSETNKVASVWDSLTDSDLNWKPHTRSSTVGEILRHQLLSERRFFGEFLGTPEPPATNVLPSDLTVPAYRMRLVELARPRLAFLAGQTSAWWLEPVRFFDTERQRVWVFWRRVLHTCHHRTQVTVYLRLLDRSVPPTYGPTADVSWSGADPTNTVDAAARR